jgi:hypothetical protein
LNRPVLGDAGFGRVAELLEEVSAIFKLGDGLQVIPPEEILLPAGENVLRPQQPLSLIRADVRVEAG